LPDSKSISPKLHGSSSRNFPKTIRPEFGGRIAKESEPSNLRDRFGLTRKSELHYLNESFCGMVVSTGAGQGCGVGGNRDAWTWQG